MHTIYNLFQWLLWICFIYTLLNSDLHVTAGRLKVKTGGDENNSFVEEETEKGWEVFTEIESEETIIPRTIKITKAPHKEKEEDDEDEKPTEAKQTKKPKEEDDEEGPGKKIGEEVSIKLPKQVRKSSNLHYSSLYNLLIIPLSLICV
ncbi:uncharacterized protein DC041_0000354 [Schistosoma bovis]|uniref:Uncharacterized protein n=1 Tax=Schistosoma bovis TaxID=6184 RepID=A0A430Q8E1_SCHBO|nr:uncharacterized protein DC041_0000354 [Schistosoma bovis]